MTARELADKALEYRSDQGTHLQRIYARFDLKAALDHAPGCESCTHRFGSDTEALREALALIPGGA